MITIDARAAQRIQPYLLSDETMHWAGVPNPNIIFHSDDWALVPFSLLWGGFAIVWEAGALGYFGDTQNSDAFMVLWGIPFVLVGQYMIWGRFLHDAWLKRRTYYAVTNHRVVAIQDGWSINTSTTLLQGITGIEREGDAVGTLWFGPKYPVMGGKGEKKRSSSRFELGQPTIFADIEGVDAVHRLVMELRAKEERNPLPPPVLTYPAFS